MVLQSREQRAHALLPQHFHHQNQRAVAGRLGDAQMKKTVAGQRLPLLLVLDALHLLKCIFNGPDLRPFGGLCRPGSAFALDEPACAQQLERAQRRLHWASRLTVAARPEHVDARADPHLHKPLDFQRDQRLAHRGSRHAQLSRQVSLRRQPRPGRKLLGPDQRTDLVSDLAIEPAGFDTLDRHRLPESWR